MRIWKNVGACRQDIFCGENGKMAVREDFDKWVQQIITSNVGFQNAAISIFNIKPPFCICIYLVITKFLLFNQQTKIQSVLQTSDLVLFWLDLKVCNILLSLLHKQKIKIGVSLVEIRDQWFIMRLVGWVYLVFLSCLLSSYNIFWIFIFHLLTLRNWPAHVYHM